MKNTHNNTVGSSVERTDERINQTGEVFTPLDLCEQMIDDIPLSTLQNPESTFLDNSAGCGNFILALINRLTNYHDRQHVIDNMVYCVELMEDNHKEICDKVGVSYDHPHYVCADALAYDYSFGQPQGLMAHYN